MLPRNHSDRIEIAFDDHRLVAYAGLLLPATLARTPGLAIDGAVWAVFAKIRRVPFGFVGSPRRVPFYIPAFARQ